MKLWWVEARARSGGWIVVIRLEGVGSDWGGRSAKEPREREIQCVGMPGALKISSRRDLWSGVQMTSLAETMERQWRRVWWRRAVFTYAGTAPSLERA